MTDRIREASQSILPRRANINLHCTEWLSEFGHKFVVVEWLTFAVCVVGVL